MSAVTNSASPRDNGRRDVQRVVRADENGRCLREARFQRGRLSRPDPYRRTTDPVNTAKFAILQKYNRVNLVVPVDAPHMWHAAMGSKACKLTVLGEHYRRLVKKGQI